MKLGDLLSPEQYALEIMNGIEEVRGNLPEDGNDVEEALSLAKKALEKQIPKKVIELNEKEDESFYCLDFMCPFCKNAVIRQPYRPRHCKHCGQKLDWGD